MNLSKLCITRSIRNISLSLLPAAGLFAQGTVIQVHKLVNPPSLATFQNTYLPGSVTQPDFGFKLGGIGSGLYKGPGDGPGIFWMVTDRGPNPQDGSSPIRRAFPVAQFTPFILKVKADNGTITVLQAIPIKGNGGGGVSGLPNDPSTVNAPANPLPLADERPYACDTVAGTTASPAKKFGTVIAGNHDGLDTEDIVVDKQGNFWTIEEYGPSIVKIDKSGRVVKRFVPAGRETVSGDHYPVVGNLPAILGRRPRNRGFEGLAITPNRKTLMAVVQSPLTNPTTTVGNPSRVIRLIEFDIEKEKPVGEYVYVMQSVNEFAPSPANPTEMKISAIAALDEHKFLVDERTDLVAKLYVVDTKKATNILGSKWDNLPATTTEVTLESLAQYVAATTTTPASTTDTLLANGVVELTKSLAVDLSQLRNPNGTPFATPQKIEGIAVLDGKTIAIANDNDFQVANGTATVDATCVPSAAGVDSQIMIVKLDKPIKGEDDDDEDEDDDN